MYRWVGFLFLVTLISCSTSGNNSNKKDGITSFDETYDFGESGHKDCLEKNKFDSVDKITFQDLFDTKDDLSSINYCSLTGRVIDENGASLEGVILVLCIHTNCFFKKSDKKGTFNYESIKNLKGALKVVGKMKGLISLGIPVSGCHGKSVVDLGDIILIPLGQGEKVNAKTGGKITTGDLTLTLPPNIQFPNFETEANVVATKVPIKILHPLLKTDILPTKVYTFDPYGTELSGKCDITFKLSDLKGLNVSVFYLDYLTGKWVKTFEGSVDKDGYLNLNGQGPDILTMIAITKN